ncbi:MAG TPA: ATP-grasp domain-containing protein [Candidatus Aquilonibacter sp.]
MLPHLLHDAGVSTTAFSPWHLKLNPYVSEHIAGSRDVVEAAAQLEQLLALRRFNWVIIADDDLLRALVERSNIAAPPSWLPFDPRNSDARSLLLSKHEFAGCATHFGIPVPESHLAGTVEEAALHAENLGFPVVLKGAYGSAGDAVHVVNDASALHAASAKFFASCRHVLVQRYVKGPVAAAYVLYDRGEVVGASTHLLECPFPNGFSAPTLRLPFVHPTVNAALYAVGAATHFHGLAGIDFVQDEKTGELFALEVNPRPTAGFSDGPATRKFFAPLVAAFLKGQAPRMRVYDGPASAQFPAYLFYFLMRADKRSTQSYRHALDSLAKMRADNARLAAWQVARFMRDQVRSFADRMSPVEFLKGLVVSILGPASWLACKSLEWTLDQTDRCIESVASRARR